MGQRIHDGNWWQQRLHRILKTLKEIRRLPRHLLGYCQENCPYDQSVIFKNPHSVELDATVKIGRKTIIEHSVSILGRSKIGVNCHIGPNVTITDSTIGNDVHIGHGAQLTRCEIGEKTKIPHVCYLGDASIGEESNIGYGTGTSDFDGLEKQKTIIGSRCFVGTFVDIIAPVTIGDECFIASRTRLASKYPIPPYSFVIEEVRYGRPVIVWKENCSFKSPHHWVWIWTKTPVDPKLMAHFFSSLKMYLGDYKEWLKTPLIKLGNLTPRSFLKEQGAEGAEKLLDIVKDDGR